ncbi:MAG: HDIG domain-containing protein, partial [Rubricoccaceae bacterium]|nr:HDIG domain-containing protein [Rubricoccaceae bacterium]
ISRARAWVGKILLVLAGYAVFFLYLYLLRPAVFANTRSMLLISLLVAGVMLAFWVLGQIELLNELAAPVALVSIMLTILFDSRVGLFATVALAAIGGLIFGFDFEFTFATIVAGFVAVFSVREVKNRSHLVLSAALVITAYLLIGFGYTMLRANPFETSRLFLDLRSILVNGMMLLLASPLMWAIERTFGMTTDIALLELSDTNRELLKQLSLRAPGTFNHSLQVANLAEAAADTIGANALLARVGALHHDIGKMNKPEYFIENQQPGDNPHDRVKPRMSAIIIGSHVKDGVEIGKQYGLPKVVQDFITTHHGTSLMEFFFRKAEETHDPTTGELDETDFRYPGPRPSTSEQAIVMLADSVEAASRSLQKPTPKRLETLIDAIVKARTEDGQLGESSLTFADLSRIKETFLAILSGVYHVRVKYPDQEGQSDEDASDGLEGPIQLSQSPGMDVSIPDVSSTRRRVADGRSDPTSDGGDKPRAGDPSAG